jgi:hypothetical protein
LITINNLELKRSGAKNMNNNKDLVDQLGKQGIAGDSLAAQQAHVRRWVELLKHRWPTALGVAIAILTFFDAVAIGHIDLGIDIILSFQVRRPVWGLSRASSPLSSKGNSAKLKP